MIDVGHSSSEKVATSSAISPKMTVAQTKV